MKSVEEHGERNLEIRLQTIDGAKNVLFVDHGCHGVRGQGGSSVQEVLVVGAIDNRVLEFLPLVVVDEDVAHDGVQPSFDIRALLEIVLIPQRFHHRILDQIVCILRISGEPQCKTSEKLAVVNQKMVEFQCTHDSWVILFNPCRQRLNKNSLHPKECSTFFHKRSTKFHNCLYRPSRATNAIPRSLTNKPSICFLSVEICPNPHRVSIQALVQGGPIRINRDQVIRLHALEHLAA